MESIINAIQNADKIVTAVYALAGTLAAATDAVPFVTGLYSIIKPLVKKI